MTRTYRIEPSPKATAFPEPLAANRAQYQEQGAAPASVPDRPIGAPRRRPTQARNHETYQADPDGVDKGLPADEASSAASSSSALEADDETTVAMTPDEAINAFGRRS